MKITVEARVLGERPEVGVGAMWLNLSATRIRVADLVRLTVEEQVRTLAALRKLSAAEIEQRLGRQYGDPVRQRKLRIGVPAPNERLEVERALEACRAGTCLVVLDGNVLADLEQEIVLEPDSKVQFLRLLPLAGG